MNASESITQKSDRASQFNNLKQGWTQSLVSSLHRSLNPLNLLKPLRQWLDRVEIRDPQLAKMICQTIPTQCPFERNITMFGHILLHIPPLCKLNPLYEEVVGLRFRALCYLADECGEDVTAYC